MEMKYMVGRYVFFLLTGLFTYSNLGVEPSLIELAVVNNNGLPPAQLWYRDGKAMLLK